MINRIVMTIIIIAMNRTAHRASRVITMLVVLKVPLPGELSDEDQSLVVAVALIVSTLMEGLVSTSTDCDPHPPLSLKSFSTFLFSFSPSEDFLTTSSRKAKRRLVF